MSSAATKRVALVTGANKGIGYQIVHQLATGDPQLTVLLGSRDAARGAEAAKQLNLSNVHALQIDVTSDASLDQAVSEVKTKYGGLDLLCNNAGIFLRGKDTTTDAAAVDETLATNYYAVINSCARFAPLLRANARVVNVASQLGVSAMMQMSPAVKKQLQEETTTLDQLTQQVKQFREAFVQGQTSAQGFPASAYGVSKAGAILASKLLASQAKDGVTYFSACPGWCQTDMTAGSGAPRSPEDGASMIVFPLTMPNLQETTGAFYENKKVTQYAGL